MCAGARVFFCMCGRVAKRPLTVRVMETRGKERAVKRLRRGGPLEHSSDWILAHGFLIGRLLLVTTV